MELIFRSNPSEFESSNQVQYLTIDLTQLDLVHTASLNFVNKDVSPNLYDFTSPDQCLPSGSKICLEHVLTRDPQLENELTSRNYSKHVMPEELRLMTPLHYYNDICSAELTTSIYEYAIKEISIDERRVFRNSILKELEIYIKDKDIDLSEINFFTTYINIRKYISEKVSPHINDIIRTMDVLITPGMPISSIKYAYISNYAFFDELCKRCKDIVKTIDKIDHKEFYNIFQSRITLGHRGILRFVNMETSEKNIISQLSKNLIMNTISDLPQKIICVIKEFELAKVSHCVFSIIHDVLVPKSLIANIKCILHSIKEEIVADKPLRSNFDDYRKLFDKYLAKLEEKIRNSVVLHGETALLPNKYTIELMAKYLLLDITNICFNFHHQLSNFTSDRFDSMKYDACSMELLLPKKEAPVPIKSSCNPPDSTGSITGIYRLAITMIDIDLEDFKKSLMSKIHGKVLAKRFRKIHFNPDLKITRAHIKRYISKLFDPFWDEISLELRSKINVCEGMSTEQLRSMYTLNELLNFKFHELCNRIVKYTESCDDKILSSLMQSSVRLESGVAPSEKIRIGRDTKRGLTDDIKLLLVSTIMSVPQKVSDVIKLLPQSTIVECFFSLFDNIYIYNKSLLKVRSVFDSTQKKIINDEILSESAYKISHTIGTFAQSNRLNVISDFHRLIDRYTVDGELSTSEYLRKLVNEQFYEFENDQNEPIMIIYNNNVSIANTETRYSILGRFKSSLISQATTSYRELCILNSGINATHGLGIVP